MVLFDFLNNRIEKYLDEGAYDAVETPNEELIVAFANRIVVYSPEFKQTSR